jgi:hypothetical protein
VLLYTHVNVATAWQLQDELCCRFMLTYQELLRIAKSDKSQVIEVMK